MRRGAGPAVRVSRRSGPLVIAGRSSRRPVSGAFAAGQQRVNSAPEPAVSAARAWWRGDIGPRDGV